MKKRNIPIILGTFLLTAGAFFALALAWSHKKVENPTDLINISELSEGFMEDYFGEIAKYQTNEDKENMLIAIANDKIQNTYGAKKIIETPNNQYILLYNSEEEKSLALEKLKENSNILSIEENETYTTEEVNYNSWGIEKMSLDYAINSANSNIENIEEVTAAIIDTGCDITLFNKYYGGKIAEFYDVLEQSTTTMVDENGHGTHIAGTIAEGTPDNVKILPIKVSKTGSMYSTDIIAAINYITYKNKAQVINMSFGNYSYTEAIDQAIESAKKKNIISVAAAGNDNTAKKHYPSALENTISIASVDSNLDKSTFSNYGAEITFTAPGTNIKSIMGKDASISKRNGNNDDDDHEIISGTSMATPHAVSAVAILKGYNKNLTFENIIDILKDNAQDLGEQGWDQYFGNGLISFENVEFCDGTYCDELGVYKDLNKSIASIDTTNLSLTQYNYYSITNLMGSKVTVNYTDNTSEEITIGELPNVEVLNYDPTATGNQTVTIKMGSLTTNIQTTTLISTILGGILAVASGRPDAGIAIMIGSQGSAMGQFLTYRQTEESSADRIAVDVMKKLGYSMQGFTNVMQNLRRLERLNDESDAGYLRTHPMTQNRMRDLDRFTNNAPTVKHDLSFDRVKAKLIGFMEKPADVLAYYRGKSFADRYAKAIAFYQKHEIDKSFKLLDELIKESPYDPYLYEMKGQFSFETGFVDQAIKNYEQANRLKPNQPLIELALAQAYLEKNNKQLAEKALPILIQATLDEPDLALGWRLMATAYNKLGKNLHADYAMVEYERASDKLSAAQKRAKKLLDKFDEDSLYHQRLQDIITLKDDKD